jgi:predicted esterase
VIGDHPTGPHAHHLRVQRTARYFTLGGRSAGAPEAVRSVWFVLHGYGQLASDFVRYFGDLATEDTLVVAPEAMNRFYLVSPDKAPARERPVGATWMTREDRESEIADYVEYLDVLFEDVASQAAQFGARVSVLGFSQGAATATRWAAYGHARIDRLILWGGLLPPDVDLSGGPAALRHVALTLVLGSHDQYVDATMLRAERARLGGAGIPHHLIEYEGGHSINRRIFPRLLDDVSGVSGR